MLFGSTLVSGVGGFVGGALLGAAVGAGAEGAAGCSIILAASSWLVLLQRVFEYLALRH